MTPLEVEGWKLLILMAFGGVFALVALFLLIKPREGSTENIVKVLGLEVQFSSAGMLLLLLGCGFLASPLFVPVKASHSGPTALPSDGAIDFAIEYTSAELIEVSGEEAEPNSNIATANLVPLGSLTSGHAKIDDYDTFCVDHGEKRALLFTLTHNAGTYLSARFYHRTGESLGEEVKVWQSAAVNHRLDVERSETCVTFRPGPVVPNEVWYHFTVTAQ